MPALSPGKGLVKVLLILFKVLSAYCVLTYLKQFHKMNGVGLNLHQVSQFHDYILEECRHDVIQV